jgi:hypothetical protein
LALLMKKQRILQGTRESFKCMRTRRLVDTAAPQKLRWYKTKSKRFPNETSTAFASLNRCHQCLCPVTLG